MLNQDLTRSYNQRPPAPTNMLLDRLHPESLDLLEPHIERVDLVQGSRLVEAGRAPDHLHFVETGLVALNTGCFDVAYIGPEGMTGAFIASGVDRSPYDCIVRLPGRAYKIPTQHCIAQLETCRDMQETMALYAHAFSIQLIEQSLCMANRSLEARIARLLLMYQDRLRSDEIAITHHYLSQILDVRRAGVTEVLHTLEGNHAIYSKRCLIVVRDRARLIEAARGSYGRSEAEYKRLLM